MKLSCRICTGILPSSSGTSWLGRWGGERTTLLSCEVCPLANKGHWRWPNLDWWRSERAERSVHWRTWVTDVGQILIGGEARDAATQSGLQTTFAATMGCVVFVRQQNHGKRKDYRCCASLWFSWNEMLCTLPSPQIVCPKMSAPSKYMCGISVSVYQYLSLVSSSVNASHFYSELLLLLAAWQW